MHAFFLLYELFDVFDKLLRLIHRYGIVQRNTNACGID